MTPSRDGDSQRRPALPVADRRTAARKWAAGAFSCGEAASLSTLTERGPCRKLRQDAGG